MAERPTFMPASEYSKFPPGRLASDLLRASKVDAFPVPTDLLFEIGSEKFGLLRPTQQGQFDIAGDESASDFTLPSSHEVRYRAALSMGEVIYEVPDSQRIFARDILAPQYLVSKMVPNNGFGGPGFFEIARLARDADMPSYAAIERIRDIRGAGISHRQIIAGLPDRPTDSNRGYIWSARGIRFDGSQVQEVADEIENTKSSRILVARTEYDKTMGIYRIDSGYGSQKIVRPSGEREKLLQFEFGQKVKVVGSDQFQGWQERQVQGGGVVINLDPLEGFRNAA